VHTDPVTGQMVADPGDSLAPGITPGQVSSTETAGTSTSRGGLAPDAQARLNAGRAIDLAGSTRMVDEITKAGEIAEKKAKIAQEQADREAAVTADYNQRRLQALDNADKDLQAARAAHKQAFDDYRKMQVGDFFSDKDPATGKETRNTGRMVLAAITVGLGGLMQRSNGGRNTALESLNKTMDDYFAREREKILKAKDISNEAKDRIGDVAQNQVAALKALDIKEAAARSKVADEMKVRLAAFGVPQAQIDTNKAVIEQQQKAAEKLQKVDDSERTHIVSTHTKALQQPGTGMVFGPGGQPIVDTGDKAKGEKVNAAIANYRTINALIGDLKASYAKGAAMPGIGEGATRQAIQTKLLLKLKEQDKLGALSGGDIGLETAGVGGLIAQLTGVGGADRLDVVKKQADRDVVAFLDSQGLAGSKVLGAAAGAPAVTAAPAAPAPARAPSAPTAPAKPASPAVGLSSADRAKLLLHLKRNPNDPRAPEIRAALGM